MTNSVMSSSLQKPSWLRADGLVRPRVFFFSICSPQKPQESVFESANVLSVSHKTCRFGRQESSLIGQATDVFTHEKAGLKFRLCNPQILPVTTQQTHVLVSLLSLLITAKVCTKFLLFQFSSMYGLPLLLQLRNRWRRKGSYKLPWAFSPPTYSAFKVASWLAASPRLAVGNNKVIENVI